MTREEFRSFVRRLRLYYGINYVAHPDNVTRAENDIAETRPHDAQLSLRLEALHRAQIELARYLVSKDEGRSFDSVWNLDRRDAP